MALLLGVTNLLIVLRAVTRLGKKRETRSAVSVAEVRDKMAWA
jgi:hypothetical protein